METYLIFIYCKTFTIINMAVFFKLIYSIPTASQVALVVKNCLPMQETIRDVGSIPRLGNPLEKEMATHSSILAWRIP